MKKVVSVLMALALVLSLGMTVFAAEGTIMGTDGNTVAPTSPVDASQPSTIQFKVYYKDNKGQELTAENTYPKEELSFTPTSDDGPVVTESMPKLTVNSSTVANGVANVTVTIPTTYNVPGKYNYTITQKEGNTAGVTYDNRTIGIQVVVTYDETGNHLMKQVTFSGKDSTNKKINSLVNTYVVSGDSTSGNNEFSVTKKVTGNLGSREQVFDVKVVLTATKEVMTNIEVGGGGIKNPENWSNGNGTGTLEFTIQVKHGSDPVVIKGVPKGITYTVTEDAKHLVTTATPTTLSNDPSKDYTVSYAVGGSELTNNQSATGEICNESKDNVEITNHKQDNSVKPETGVYLDSLPYILLLAFAAVGLLFFLTHRRKEQEEF